MLAQRPHQMRHVTVLSGPGEHDRGPSQQRREKLPQGGVEADGSLLQHAIEARELQLLHDPADVIDQPAVRYEYALRLSGRPGGVDQVSRLLRRARHAGVGARCLRELLRLVHAHQRCAAIASRSAEVSENRFLGEDHRRGRVMQHPAQTLDRVLRIERHESPAGFENRQERNRELEGALQTHTHRDIASDADPDQLVGQTIRPRIELGVDQLSAL